MPITNDTIIEANQKMLGKTNRTILFARVNLDEFVDPDAPEGERQLTPSLAEMLARINETSEEQFLSELRERLTVTSFRDFLDKFQPGFYYRVRPPKETADTSGGEDGATPSGSPELEFSLEGGIGWKKVRITSDHPYIRCLSDLIKKRVRQDVSTFRVDVDASLFAFKPRNQRMLMRKIAEDVQAKNDRLLLEAKRNPGSKDTKRALEAYQHTAEEFQTALEDTVRVLPTVVYGLEQTARELKRLAPGGGPADTNVYQIEFGKNRSLIATPKQLPQPPAAVPEDDGAAKLEGKGKKAIEGSGDKSALAKADSAGGAVAAPADNTLTVRSIESALDRIREESAKMSEVDLALVPQERRLPVTVGKFIDKMINQGMIPPLMGNLVATVLQNPKELALLNPEIKDVELYHDMFLGVYSNAIEQFLQTVTPLFETIMGVYLLFNEFPSDVRIPESMRPELVVANADLPDLFLTRHDELKRYFDIACAQATNQFRDAISFAIVPNVAEFRKRRPSGKARPTDTINLIDDDVFSQIKAAQEKDLYDEVGYGKVAFVDEMLDLMDWGYQYGFQVLFSPEDRVRAGRIHRDFFAEMNEAYAVESVVERESGDCAILCLPDFVILPPDGKLVTGRTADGAIEVGVDVPELTVRSCYVAAGRLMALEVPDYLRRKLQKAKKDPTLVRADLPGVGVDLAQNPFLGETDLPTDHFLNDGVLGELLSPDMPFLVFTHVAGRSPFLSVPRTMRRLHSGESGERVYRHLHLFRQQVYLNRLLRAAHELGYGGSWPSDNAEAEQMFTDHMNFLLKWTRWYDPTKLINSFPSRLKEGDEFSVRREEGNSFRVALNFEQGLVAEFKVAF
ncbi:MAG: hypothetical protein H7Z41_11295 [Cytophagales bacterium]|nr:hypothetical protein [Armatimonadota bacterium]